MNFLSWSVEILPQKNQMTAGFFFNFHFHRLPTPLPPPTPFSFSLLSSYFCRLDDSLKINRSPFKFQTTLYIVFWTYWEQICVNLEIAELDSIVLILPSNNPCFFSTEFVKGHGAHYGRAWCSRMLLAKDVPSSNADFVDELLFLESSTLMYEILSIKFHWWNFIHSSLRIHGECSWTFMHGIWMIFNAEWTTFHGWIILHPKISWIFMDGLPFHFDGFKSTS
jgi:hypothetical protein